MRTRLIVLIVAFGLIATAVPAQEESQINTDEESLFGSEDDLFGGDTGELVTEPEESEVDLAKGLLVSEAVDIGGRFDFSMQATSGWNDAGTVFDNFLDPDVLRLSTSLSSRLFIDARPDEGFRVFGKMTVSYPFAEDPDDPSDPADPVRELQDVFHVEELFSDFNWNDTVFFRGGKQTMNWGVGYFYSPADLLSIAEIDPEDPEAEREGPVALKVNVPIDIHNAYFYLIPPRITDPEPLDLGIAAKGEIVVGAGEITFGGIYQRDIAPAGMVTASFSVGDFDLFAEGVVSYGSNRTYVTEIDTPPFVATELRENELVFNATGGLRYVYSPVESESTLSLVAQYLYNGEGYTDPSILFDNQAGVGALLAAGDLTASDLANTGQHYSAANVSFSDLFGSGITTSVLWIQNYSDLSAMVTPSLSREFLDHFQLTIGVPMRFGETGDELSPTGNSIFAYVSASIGGGSF